MISVKGNIVASPCKIDSDSLNQSIRLGALVASELKEAGSAGPQKVFQVKFYDCPYGTSAINLSFSGEPDSVEPASSYKNNGDASNIFIRLMTKDNRPAGPGQIVTGVLNGNNNFIFDFVTQAVSKGNATVGSITAAATFTITYS
ncbi:type 1 fimbrial protein [Enterobacter bugandensis]|uniref:fimbrial protein n=1 Tax=Enterobacter bugandensis TaxID=881260 RepID=UPI0023AE9881|nr:fimbrial protein [Enterobacter bugandensis]MDE7590855.1 type 1 fimbrial protein [Enterobacter bugandensis]